MLEDIFGTVLPESSTCEIKGLDKNNGIVFTAGEKDRARISWTLPELIHKDDTYITMATFFGRGRQRKYIRHVLGFVIDFDTPSYMTVEAILDRYRDAGLPLPDLIIKTKTPGHYQAFNILSAPLRQKNALMQKKITMVHALMAARLGVGADTRAVGAERWVRRPTNDNIVYQDLEGRTYWEELNAWYEAYRPIKMSDRKSSKVIYIGHILGTDGGQHLQKSIAEKGQRNAWCYGLGLCLLDAGTPASEIESALFDWNSGLNDPLSDKEVSKIYKSVMSGNHHASSRIIEDLTGLPSRVNGYYHLPKSRDRRVRDHLDEVREDIINDLYYSGVVSESQKSWAARLRLSYRTLKLVISQLKNEGILEATTGRGRYAHSTYSLTLPYRDHIDEIREAIIADLYYSVDVSESLESWATRLRLSFDTLKLVLAQLENEGILEADTIGHGRYAHTTYSLTLPYRYSVDSGINLEVAAGSENFLHTGFLKGHNAISPSRVLGQPHRMGGSLNLGLSHFSSSGGFVGTCSRDPGS